jgi:hypothetical protein
MKVRESAPASLPSILATGRRDWATTAALAGGRIASYREKAVLDIRVG